MMQSSHHTDGDISASRVNIPGNRNATVSVTSPPSDEPPIPVYSPSRRVR